MNPKVLTVGSAYFSMNLEIPAVPPPEEVQKSRNTSVIPTGAV